MYNWENDYIRPASTGRLNLILFAAAALLAIVAYLTLHPKIDQINAESPLLINIMFFPSLAIGFFYGMRITEKAVRPSQTRSPNRRMMIKFFLFIFVIGGLFSSVSFSLNGGSIMPDASVLDDGLMTWILQYINENGGATFLIVSSIALMAAATRRIIPLGGFSNSLFTFVGTFIFFSMMALSFTQSNPSNSEVYLYTFYQAGVVGGALYEMNKLTRNINDLEDFGNGYL